MRDSRRVDRALFVLLLLGLAVFVGALIHQGRVWPADDAQQPPGSAALWPYWISFALLWALLSIAFVRFRRARSARAGAAWVIFTLALAARLVVVFTTRPVLSDDVWRYVLDGATLADGRHPYALAPAALDSDNTPPDALPVLDRINHPELVTIYQPVSQYVFAGLAVLRNPAADPLGGRTFRLGFVAFDMVIIVLLLRKLHRDHRSPWPAAMYAWHPLVISEVAGSGHQEPVGIALLLGALLLLDAAPRRALRTFVAGFTFALGAAVKPVIAPLALPIAWARRRSILALALGMAGALLAVYLPLALWRPGLSPMLDTADVFFDYWTFNGSLYPLLLAVLGNRAVVTVLAAVALMLVLVVSTLRGGAALRGSELPRITVTYLLALLLLSSTIHPWYVLWPLALLPLRFNLAVWVFSLTVSWSYAAHLTGDYIPPTWVLVVEYLPVYAALLVQSVIPLRSDAATPR